MASILWYSLVRTSTGTVSYKHLSLFDFGITYEARLGLNGECRSCKVSRLIGAHCLVLLVQNTIIVSIQPPRQQQSSSVRRNSHACEAPHRKSASTSGSEQKGLISKELYQHHCQPHLPGRPRS